MKRDNLVIVILTICIIILALLIIYKAVALKKDNKKIVTHFDSLIGEYYGF